jgi:hypothetical protein
MLARAAGLLHMIADLLCSTAEDGARREAPAQTVADFGFKFQVSGFKLKPPEPET